MAKWLTVPEVAARYRVSERTVYRWYGSGRLKPMKIGREWLLAETPDGEPAAPPSRMWQGHVVALVDSLEQAARLERELLAHGNALGARLFRGQWRDPAVPPDVDLGAVLRSQGADAVLDIWRHEAAAAAREGRPLYALSDPPPRDFRPFDTLLQYESAASQIDWGPGSVVCLYRCNQLTGPQLSELLCAHDAAYLPTAEGWLEFRKATPSRHDPS